MRRNGTEFSREEAIDILSQCRLLQVSLDDLKKRAERSLRRSQLRVVRDDKESDHMDVYTLRVSAGIGEDEEWDEGVVHPSEGGSELESD